jgi:hypothetical protein
MDAGVASGLGLGLGLGVGGVTFVRYELGRLHDLDAARLLFHRTFARAHYAHAAINGTGAGASANVTGTAAATCSPVVAAPASSSSFASWSSSSWSQGPAAAPPLLSLAPATRLSPLVHALARHLGLLGPGAGASGSGNAGGVGDRAGPESKGRDCDSAPGSAGADAVDVAQRLLALASGNPLLVETIARALNFHNNNNNNTTNNSGSFNGSSSINNSNDNGSSNNVKSVGAAAVSQGSAATIFQDQQVPALIVAAFQAWLGLEHAGLERRASEGASPPWPAPLPIGAPASLRALIWSGFLVMLQQHRHLASAAAQG